MTRKEKLAELDKLCVNFFTHNDLALLGAIVNKYYADKETGLLQDYVIRMWTDPRWKICGESGPVVWKD